MLQEKKISSKINYDVLKSLNVSVENEEKIKTSDPAASDPVTSQEEPQTAK